MSSLAVQLPKNEEDRRCLRAPPGETGARFILPDHPNPAQRVPRIQLRAAPDFVCHYRQARITKEDFAAILVTTDPAEGSRRGVFSEIHENPLCSIRIKPRSEKAR